MPHYKCEACKARLRVSGKTAELVGDLCPACGSLLEPVAVLAELVGYRSITPRDGASPTPQSEPHRRIVDLLDESIARQASRLERDHLDAERWLGDDSDEPAAAAVALPPPGIYS
jgi:hypothetical protein